MTGKRGLKPQGKVRIKWSNEFAYAIGLLVTDGCLYNDGRHMSLATADLEQAENFKKCLGLRVKIGTKFSRKKKQNKCWHVQFGDVLFYKFLLGIGLTPAKSKTLGAIEIPGRYFFDYLRGCFDGDGTFYSYWDRRFRSSHMFYVIFYSASLEHVSWLRQEINQRLNVQGSVTKAQNSSVHALKYAKKEALEIIRKMYYNPRVACLSRKRLKIKEALVVEKGQQTRYRVKQ